MLAQDEMLHVASPEAWAQGKADGRYYPPGFEREGFIHCCHRHQLERVLRDHFAGADNVLLLVLDPSRIEAKVQYDRAPNGDDYPHIYGPIEPSAVVREVPLTRGASGWDVPREV